MSQPSPSGASTMLNILKRKASSSDHDSNSKRTMHLFSGGLDEFGDAGIRSSENPAASSSENDLAVPDEAAVSENPAPSSDLHIDPRGQSSSQNAHPTRSWVRTAGYGIQNAVDVVYQAADVFPPLKSALGGSLAILNTWNQVTGNKGTVNAMMERLSYLHDLIPELKSADLKESDRRRKLEEKLKPISSKLGQMKDQNVMERMGRSTSDQQLLSGFIDEIRDALTDYQLSTQLDLYKMGRATMEKTDLIFLEALPRAKEASFQSGDRPSCIPGTRTAVLLEITKWDEESGDHPIYWLCGNAGCGKSTIAQSFAKICFAKGLLGASFFCSRDYGDLSNIKLIFPTLAFQLANRYPEFRADLVEVIKGTQDIGHQSLDNQLENLLIGPLTRIGLSTLIVIDALDECKDDKPESAILSLLAKHINKIPEVRFFITSRLDSRIYHGHHLGLLGPLTEVCRLHEVKREAVNDDIKLYLERRLSKIAVTTENPKLPDAWPSSSELTILGDMCSGLFICALTLIKMFESPDDHPGSRLRSIIDDTNDTSRIGVWGLDDMYRIAMAKGFPERSKRDKSIMAKVRLVVGSIVLMFNPLSRSHLATLLGMSSDDIFNRVRTLYSVLHIPESKEKPIRVYHKSFPDFIGDLERCEDKDFYIDPSYYHGELAIHCLELMTTKLTKTNICDLPRYAMNRDVEDLPALREKWIGDGLEYACTFWARHLRLAVNSGQIHHIPKILELLDSFAKQNLLIWLEILAIIKELRTAVYSLLDVRSWLGKVGTGKNVEWLLRLFEDAERFVLRFTEVIQESASHIYESALFWTPTSSLVRKAYSNQADLKMLIKPERDWDSCYCSFAVPDLARAVAFSYSGGMIAAGGDNGFLRIYDAVTGVCQVIFKGHDDEGVNSVAFTPKDDLVVSGSNDRTVRIWNVQTGSLTSTLIGHTHWVQSVAVSPAGDKVVSGSFDGTLRVWNISSNDCERVIDTYYDWNLHVCWLGSTLTFVSSGVDGKIKLWDSQSGKCIKTFQDQGNSVHGIASPSDGSKIAYFATRDKIVIQNTETAEIVGTFPFRTDGVNSLDFSSDGNHIVTSGDERTVVWDLVQQSHVSIFKSNVECVSFSPNGKSVALGCGGAVRVFQYERGDKSTATFDCHSSAVNGVQFILDGQFLASFSKSDVKIWDCKTGSCIHTLFSENWEDINMEVSHDSKFVAILDEDHHLYLWNLQERQEIWSREISGHTPGQIAFSPDDKYIVCTLYRSIILLDVESGSQLAFLQDDSLSVFRVLFSGEYTIISYNEERRSQQWRIALADAHNNNDLPMVFLPVSGDDLVSPTEIGELKSVLDDVWILDELGRRVCWIPHEWRCSFDVFAPNPSVSYGNKIALGGESGRICILNFSRATDSQVALT